MSTGLDVRRLAADWLRSLRGRRSQVAFSRRFGYRSNIAYRWEAGRCFPSASGTLKMVAALGGDVARSLQSFYRSTPPWLAEVDPCTPVGVARLLSDLRGDVTVAELARRTGFSRFALSRWLAAKADPTLPEFLTLIELTSRRLLDLLAAFTDPSALPSARHAWKLLEGARQAAYDEPWSHAVLRALELEAYRERPRHEPGWIARRLGIDLAVERSSLAVLERSGQIHFDGRRYEPTEIQSVDTRADPARARALRATWAAVGVERLRAGEPGLLSYNLGMVSRADLERLEQLQRAHYRKLVNVIAESTPGECVVLYAAQLLELTAARGAPELEPALSAIENTFFAS
jgi:transcriptional regulator with XRE-family HTH domain